MAVDHLAQTRPLDGLGMAIKVRSGRWVRVNTGLERARERPLRKGATGAFKKTLH